MNPVDPQQPAAPRRRRFLEQLGAASAASALLPALAVVTSGSARAVAMEPLGTRGRLEANLALRGRVAAQGALQTAFGHSVNRDDETIPSLSGNYSKGLRHNALGEVEPASYLSLISALSSGRPADFAAIQLGGPVKQANPQAALAYQLEGTDSNALAMPAPPSFSSEAMAGEMAEVYWHALLRDLPFSRYASDPLAAAAVADLRRFEGFREVTPASLFRGDTAGDLDGPYLSQFLWLDVPYGAHSIVQR